MPMSNTLAAHPKQPTDFRRLGILFAGGPAPAANAVISTCAASFLRNDIQVYGILNGYSRLIDYSVEQPLQRDEAYVEVDGHLLRRTRNSQGILIGTSRANPGRAIGHPSHFQDPQRTEPLRCVYEGLRSLGIDALVSIGGDDTLKTANKLALFQDTLSDGSPRIPIVHVPKTIDNDYHGIDFTFGFFTAVDALANEVRNLVYDAEASRSYFMAETMGRSAGWLAYGAAIAGEASLVISVEDITNEFRDEETYTDPASGRQIVRPIMNVDKVIDRIVRTMLAREREGKPFGVIVIAEGLAEYLPMNYLEGSPRDEHGHISISHVNLCHKFAQFVTRAYQNATKGSRKVTGLQLGYESRCSRPNAFDVMLGSQLGVGAYRALVEEKLDSVMVSVYGQLQLHYEPFAKLIDAETLITKVRFIDPSSDFHSLARFLETQVNE